MAFPITFPLNLASKPIKDMNEMPWRFAEERKDEKSPYEYLQEAAAQLRTFTKGQILADVMQIIEDDLSVVNSFLLVVPELRHYNYKLIEVRQATFDINYPADLKLFGTAPQNIVEVNEVPQNSFNHELNFLIAHPLTQGILSSLRTYIEIARDSRKGE